MMIHNSWLFQSNFNFDTIPIRYHEWLQFSDCISNYCKKKHFDYNLTLLEQSWNKSISMLERKVIIFINNVPAIFGKTTIPKASYLQFKTIIDNLKNKPIGEKIFFCDRKTKRSQFEYQCLSSNNIDYDVRLHDFVPNQLDVYGRRSCIKVETYPFFLTELFLPKIPDFQK